MSVGDDIHSGPARLAAHRIEKLITAQTLELGAGRATSWDDYQHRTGRIAGLRKALQEIDGALVAFHGDDDLDADFDNP